MTPSLLGVKGKSPCDESAMASSASADSICNSSGLIEHNYLGFSESSSVDSSVASNVMNENKNSLTLKATELCLGLPGSLSPKQESEFPPTEFDEKQLFPLQITNSGNKRRFSDGVSGLSSSKTTTCPEVNWMLKPRMHSDVVAKTSLECAGKTGSNANNAPVAKIQAVGWPPVRSSRKNIMPITSKNNGVNGKPSSATLLVKVSMEGAPYLRKVDLRAFSTYKELSSALENMFDCFVIGQCRPMCKELPTEGKLKDLINGSDYALTYEDKDGDWMLVGDVPWEMFIVSCKRLKIMKGSDAIGLAPRVMDKSKNRS